jgi:putative endonuclease
MFYVYILQCKDSSLYCGSTNDLKQRELLHNSGKGSKYVRSRGGGRIVYSEKFKIWGKALSREAEVKKLTRQEKLNLIRHGLQTHKPASRKRVPKASARPNTGNHKS